ncbi:MAG: DUF348 domain-containing protein [Coriobacteriia bacterium]|nr:DUF348 domain-containing protein [Coriobacteriia bacterium]
MRYKPTCSARSSRTKNIIVAFVAAFIVVISFTGFVWAQKQITVVVDGRARYMETQAISVEGFLEDAGIPYSQGDVVSPTLDTRITPGMTVVLRHAVQVTLDVGGTKVQMRIVGTTVADALVAAGIDPTDNPAVQPGLDAKLTSGMIISLPNSFVRVTEDTVDVPFATETDSDPKMLVGESREVVAGANGVATNVYHTTVVNGVESEKVLFSTTVLTPAVNQVVVVGSMAPKKITVNFNLASAAPAAYARSLQVVATAYSAMQPELDEHTASGTLARRGVIAVDPSVIPLGTRVYVPGYGYAVAEDTGGAIKGDRIDVCFDSLVECDAWGRRTVTILILN